MSRNYSIYLADILDAIERIEEYTQNIAFDYFKRDRMRFDAVIRNMEIIGEAVKPIPQSIRDKYADIEWRQIAGLRDILIHKYFDINIEIIWDVVQSKLPILKTQIQHIIEEK